MTPPTIHLFWADSTPPVYLGPHIDAWRRLHPNWDVTLWTDASAELRDVVARARESCLWVYPPDRTRHVANVIRWHVLSVYGGIWADCDVRPLIPLDELRGDRPFTAAEGTVPAPFVAGGPQGHRLWRATLDASLDSPRGRSPSASGGLLLQRIMTWGEIELLPYAQFASHDAHGRPLPLYGARRYTTHGWATSSVRNSEVPRT